MNDTLKWKESVDENSRFIEDGILPSVLVENKIDLVEEDKVKEEIQIIQFAKENKFVVFFRISVRMGIGVDECM